MGKSDPYVFEAYSHHLDAFSVGYPNIAFLGFQGENEFSKRIPGGKDARDFYDRALGNWDINDEWKLDRTYDAIVCTRCAYFSRDPKDFLGRCRDHLKPNGLLFVDWGLGDHWRFDRYKVGWVRGEEHEHAYGEDNELHSCYWHPRFESVNFVIPEVVSFWRDAKRVGGYDERFLIDVVKKEVPAVVNAYQGFDILEESFLSLWPNSPQLYIMHLLRKRDE